MGLYDFSTENFVLDENFLADNASRTIHFNEKTQHPIISAIRLNKYISRGYKASNSTLFKIMLTISALNISSYDELENNIGGVYGKTYDSVVDSLKKEKLEFDINYVISKLDSLNFDVPDYEHSNSYSCEWSCSNYAVNKIEINKILGKK